LSEARVSVSPTYNKEQATASLSAPATSFPARLWSKPSHPTRVELIYLPYYFFDVTLSQDDGTQKVGVAIDAVLGSSVFFNLQAGEGALPILGRVLQEARVLRLQGARRCFR
jgi:hypothetical protein